MDEANEQLPSWSKVKGFKLLNAHLTVANGLLNSQLKVNRVKVNEVFSTEIDSLYGEELSFSSEFVGAQGLRPSNSQFVGANGDSPVIRSDVPWNVYTMVRNLIKTNILWKPIKDYIVSSWFVPWKLEKTSDSEQLESEITTETQIS